MASPPPTPRLHSRTASSSTISIADLSHQMSTHSLSSQQQRHPTQPSTFPSQHRHQHTHPRNLSRVDSATSFTSTSTPPNTSISTPTTKGRAVTWSPHTPTPTELESDRGWQFWRLESSPSGSASEETENEDSQPLFSRCASPLQLDGHAAATHSHSHPHSHAQARAPPQEQIHGHARSRARKSHTLPSRSAHTLQSSGPAHTHASALRRRRQEAVRAQCSSGHLAEISALVARMVEEGRMCEFVEFGGAGRAEGDVLVEGDRGEEMEVEMDGEEGESGDEGSESGWSVGTNASVGRSAWRGWGAGSGPRAGVGGAGVGKCGVSKVVGGGRRRARRTRGCA